MNPPDVCSSLSQLCVFMVGKSMPKTHVLLARVFSCLPCSGHASWSTPCSSKLEGLPSMGVPSYTHSEQMSQYVGRFCYLAGASCAFPSNQTNKAVGTQTFSECTGGSAFLYMASWSRCTHARFEAPLAHRVPQGQPSVRCVPLAELLEIAQLRSLANWVTLKNQGAGSAE